MKYILDPDVTQNDLDELLEQLSFTPAHIRVEDLSVSCYCVPCVHFRCVRLDGEWWS